MPLSKSSKQYITDNIVNKVHFDNYQQVSGILFVLRLMSHPDFPKLLGYAGDLSKITLMKRYMTDRNCRPSTEFIVGQMTRGMSQKFSHFYHMVHILEGYQYAVDELINRIQQMVEQDWRLMGHELLQEHHTVFAELLGAGENKGVQEEVIRRYLVGVPAGNEGTLKVIHDFYLQNKDDIKRIFDLPNRSNNINLILPQYMAIRDFINDPEERKAYADHIKNSNFLKSGSDFHWEPKFWGGVCASIFGLFTAYILAVLTAQFAPFITLAPELFQTSLVAASSVMVLVFGPILVNYLVSSSILAWNQSHQRKIETAIQQDIPRYGKLLRDNGIYRQPRHRMEKNIEMYEKLHEEKDHYEFSLDYI